MGSPHPSAGHYSPQARARNALGQGVSILEGKRRDEMLLPRQGGFQASGFNKQHPQEVTKPGSLACRLETHRWAQSREAAHFSLHKHWNWFSHMVSGILRGNADA